MCKFVLDYVYGKFKHLKDRGGEPYIQHLMYVGSQAYWRNLSDIKFKYTGYLHDILEDTDTTPEDLLNLDGVTQEIVDAVVAMTHKDGEEYADYIKRVAKNPLARKVKIVDLEHNMDIKRLKRLTAKDLERLKKYHDAWLYLSEIENNNH